MPETVRERSVRLRRSFEGIPESVCGESTLECVVTEVDERRFSLDVDLLADAACSVERRNR